MVIHEHKKAQPIGLLRDCWAVRISAIWEAHGQTVKLLGLGEKLAFFLCSPPNGASCFCSLPDILVCPHLKCVPPCFLTGPNSHDSRHEGDPTAHDQDRSKLVVKGAGFFSS